MRASFAAGSAALIAAALIGVGMAASCSPDAAAPPGATADAAPVVDASGASDATDAALGDTGGASSEASADARGGPIVAAVVTAVSPLSMKAEVVGAAPYPTVTLTGSGFLPGGYVYFDGHAIATTYIGATSVSAQIHPALVTKPRTVELTYGSSTVPSNPYSADAGLMSNPVPFVLLDPGDAGTCNPAACATQYPGATGPGTGACVDNVCCAVSGLVLQAQYCCTGITFFNACQVLDGGCYDLGFSDGVSDSFVCCTLNMMGGYCN